MTTFIPADGTQVESLLAADASILITCPGCGHLTPNVPAASLIVDPTTAAAPWIDCGCQHGTGRSRFNVPISGCDCLLRFRVAPTGASNRFNVAGVDHQTMAERRIACENMVSVSMGGTIYLGIGAMPQATSVDAKRS